MRAPNKPWPRHMVLSFMASLTAITRQNKAAEGYILELVSWCAFGDLPRDRRIA